MRRFVWEVTLFAVVQLALLAFVMSRGQSDSGDYMGASIDKHRRFAQSTPPRVAFVGGSAMAFSLDSQTVEQSLGRPVINMGLHAGLGLDYMIGDFPTTSLREGDLVVLNLEYEHFCEDEAMVDVLYEALKSRPGSLQALDFHLIKKLLDEGLALPTGHLHNLVAAFRHGGRTADPRNPYQRSAFDAFGDVVAHLDLPVSRAAVQQHVESRRPLIVSDSYLASVVAELNRFAEKCRKHGAAVVQIYPAYPELLYRRNQAAIERIDKTLHASLRVPLLTRPQDALVPVDYLFDTHYHLNRQGVQWRTGAVVAALQSAMRADDNRQRASANGQISLLKPALP